MPTYYPAALVVLRIRLQEPLPIEVASAALLQEPMVLPIPLPLPIPLSILPASPADPFSLVLEVLVPRVTVRKNGLREADEASITIPAEYLPLDPRMIRALVAEVYIGAVDAPLYQAGMSMGSNIATAMLVNPIDPRKNARFMGYADEGTWNVGAGEIQLECRGMQGLLLDSKIRQGVLAGLDLNRPLHMVVYDLVNAAPMARGMRVAVRVEAGAGLAEVPILGLALPPHLIRLAPSVSKNGVGKPGARLPIEDGAESYWDIITRLCLLCGWVPTVDLDTVVLQPARTLVPGATSLVQTEIPYPVGVPRVVSVLSPVLVWGQHIEDLHFTRAWAETRRAPIELRCYVPELGVTITARWPILPTPGKVAASGAVATEEADVMIVSGINNPATLLQVAQQIWSERAYKDIGGTLTTRELTTFPVIAGIVPFTDVMDLQPGGSVTVGVQQGRFLPGSANQLEALTPPERLTRLVKHGFRPDVAAKLVAALATQPGLNTFRVSTVEHSFDVEDGYSISVGFNAYLLAGASLAAAATGAASGAAAAAGG